ncbi:MAG: Re/Si-specific NAD(P)(+) transhydrogenase subunit alpha [Planctomycetota bacterium]
MIIGVPRDTQDGERRVALIPASIAELKKKGHDVLVEKDAGVAAGFPDKHFGDAGATVVDRSKVFADAQVILEVNSFGANPDQGAADLANLNKDQTVIGFSDPLGNAEAAKQVAATGARSFSMELIPRITRAQSMDALSSMATIAGYKSVLLGAEHLPRLFPMLMTAAGTLAPARVFVIGVGVAGLQALATAKRLGAVTSAYDVRPVVKEQVQSVGAKFIELDLETGDAEGSGGYAKAQGEEFLRKQRELMLKVVSENDVVITTAAIPGRKAPILVTSEMVHAMEPGSVVVDIAAERGGNCELTKAGEVVDVNGVQIVGPLNLPSQIPYHASQMYARNITTFLNHMVKEGELTLDLEDEVVTATLVTNGGDVVHPMIREKLGMPAAEASIGSDN